MQEAATQNLVMNSLTGLSTIKSFTAESHELKRLERFSAHLKTETDDSYSLSLLYAGVTKYAIITGLVLPLAYGATMVLRGSLSVATFMLQSFMLPKLIQTMGGLDREYDLYQSATTSATRLLELLDAHPSIRSGEMAINAADVRGELTFDGVTFRYPSSGELLDEFRLHIPSNSTVAVVGSTGCGKSTLVKLLLCFYDVQDGRILLDGRDIREVDFHDLRGVIGLVSQDVFLFDGTIYENIEYGRPGASREEVIEAARVAEALDFIEQLPAKFSTLVGERGVKLSGGERQRISIARAVLKNPRIMILDEATSSVDNETEAAIRRSLTSIARDRTIIFIAHRLSSIRHVDQIHVMEGGRIIDRGTHDELVTRDGLYAALWRLQTGDPESVWHDGDGRG
jgi:ATP-binding cassette subfamily B protein